MVARFTDCFQTTTGSIVLLASKKVSNVRIEPVAYLSGGTRHGGKIGAHGKLPDTIRR